jgi:hypothetical protein
VLVKYTYTGDGNLDGAVTFDDYAAMDSAFFGLIPNLGWATGDINFDGDITFDDYSVVDQAFFFQGAPLAHAELFAVPEPSTCLMLVLAGCLCFAQQNTVVSRKRQRPEPRRVGRKRSAAPRLVVGPLIVRATARLPARSEFVDRPSCFLESRREYEARD